MTTAPLHRTEIAIIGAGVIGLAIALRLLAEGKEVTLIDPNDPGMGASYGNAGTIADYAVNPVGSPAVLKNLPSLLFNKASPLSILRSGILPLAPWLLRFAAQSLPGPTRRNSQALAALLQGTLPMWFDLADAANARGLMRNEGGLYLYHTPQSLEAAQADVTSRRAMGVSVEIISGADLATLEPNLPPMAGAAYFPGAIFLSDPAAMMRALASATLGRAEHIRAKIDGLATHADGIRLTGQDADGMPVQIHAGQVVVAAGAHSRNLTKAAGDNIPLDTERGYHVEWDMDEPLLTRPSCDTARGFYLCPMEGRLRAAGTVELGGLTAPPSPHRIQRLIEGARSIFPQLKEPSREWMGFRPSMPDSLPVIGPSAYTPNVFYAFGHGHIGVTLAPQTAEIITDLIMGRPTARDLAAVLPARFAKRHISAS